MKEVSIAGKKIGGDCPAFMIAEAGLNHNGDVRLARDLIAAAKDCGADAVKFQTFDTGEFIANNSPYFDIFKNSELSRDDFIGLKDYADSLDVLFLSTPFDFESVDLLDEIGAPAYKVASCDLTNLPFLRYIAGKQKPILLSTGAGSIGEMFSAIEAIEGEGNGDIALFHCIARYPAKPEEMNLRNIPYMAAVFGVPIGLSDHTLGVDIPLASIAVGAKMVEKHFTLDKEMPGPDHKLSATPEEFRRMVETTRIIESAMGVPRTLPSGNDADRIMIRRSLTARRDIPAGTVLAREMIAIKRPGDGIPPFLLESLLGRRTIVEIKRDEQFKYDDLA